MALNRMQKNHFIYINKIFFAILFLNTIHNSIEGSYPIFDYRTRMRVLLVPADLRPGSVIYRLRGTDPEFDYPLTFSVADDVGKSIIRIENMPCNPTHSYCQANVFLTRKLEPDRVYDLILSLKDSMGLETKVDSTIRATRATWHFEDIFPYAPNMIVVSESAKVGTVLDYVLARKNPKNSHHSYLELWGSEKFRIVQNLSTKDVTNGSIILTGELDYEEKNTYTLHIFCLDPFTKVSDDTRNVAGFQLPVIVNDDQDMPPEFNSLPPVTKISPTLQVGQKVLQIQAQDGDRGNPREIKYSLVNEGSNVFSHFNISEKTGEIFLMRPLEELATVRQPFILTVSAEEVKKNQWEPQAMANTAQVALLLENYSTNNAPYFQNQQFSARIPENSPQGTAVVFGEPYSTLVKDDDLGKNGVFSLTLENNNGTFEISPTVGEQKANFVIRVRNNDLLDYEERTYVVFTVVAKEVTQSRESSSPLESKANVTVYLDDQNDNPPVFLQEKYEAEIPENVTAGTVITQVQASDRDTGVYGKVFYTNLLGNINQSLAIDSTTGVITVATNNHGFDRESAQDYHLMVEAKDMEGLGNMATVPLIIKLLDVNDETPQFERQTFEFILQPNLRNFTSRAFVKATDKDAEKPNNIVRYEIISGNYENKFFMNEITGELFIRGKLSNMNLRPPNSDENFFDRVATGKEYESDDDLTSVIALIVRAYDLGVPHRWTHAHVRIYPPESRARTMDFIVSGSHEDRKSIEDLLRQLTGGRVSIQDIRPYTGREQGTDLTHKSGSVEDKSIVSATVFYDGKSYVDLNQVEKKLAKNRTQAVVEEQVLEYRNENRVLFWLMIFFLILLLLLLLLLCLCCIWQGCCVCPCFDSEEKTIISPMENIRFISHERSKRQDPKAMQALTYYGRKEAWSGRNGERTLHYEQNPTREKLVRQIKVEGPENYAATGTTFRSHSKDENGGPNIIYTREFVRSDRNPTMVVEDVEINPYQTKTTTLKVIEDLHPSGIHLNINSDKDLDSDSLIRHEIERGSDFNKSFRKSDKSTDLSRIAEGYQRASSNLKKEYKLVLEHPEGNLNDEELENADQEEPTRGHFYIKDGNAEILRLMSGGNQEESETFYKEPYPDVVKLDKGKDLIMKKFMEDQKHSSSNTSREEFRQELLRRLQKEFYKKNSGTTFQNNSAKSEIIHKTLRSKLRDPNYEYDPNFLGYHFQNQETQSLPGQIEISTQTEREFGTQTEELNNLRPPRRKVRSDNEFSDEEESYQDGEKAVEALDLGKGWIRREPKIFRMKKVRGQKMRTPILEEGELDQAIKYDTRPAMFKMPELEMIMNGIASGSYTENKTSILRRRKIKEKILDGKPGGNDDYSSEEEALSTKAPTKLRKSRKDLAENKQDLETPAKNSKSDSLSKLYEAVQELGESEFQRIKKETKERAASLNRFYNALEVFEAESEKDLKKAVSLTNLKNEKDNKQEAGSSMGDEPIVETQNQEKKTEKINMEVTNNEPKTHEIYIDTSEWKQNRKSNNEESKESDGQEAEKSGKPKKSKYMDWYNDLNTKKVKSRTKRVKRKEDDQDSGIAMSSLMSSKVNEQYTRERRKSENENKTKSEQLLEKKSVFTIAYDGVRTKSIRPETNSSEKR